MAPRKNVSLPEVMTQPLIAEDRTWSMTCSISSMTCGVMTFIRPGHIPGKRGDAIGIGLEAEIE
jgi:hypothetical protein